MRSLSKSSAKMRVVVNESKPLVAKDDSKAQAIRDSAFRMSFIGLFLSIISIIGVLNSPTKKPIPYLLVAFQLGICSATWTTGANPGPADIRSVLVKTTSTVALSAFFFGMSLPAWFGYTNLAIYDISRPVSYAMCIGAAWLTVARMCWMASGARSERIWWFFSTFFTFPKVDLDHLRSEWLLAFGVCIVVSTIDLFLLVQTSLVETSPESEFLVIVIPRGITKRILEFSISFAASTFFLDCLEQLGEFSVEVTEDMYDIKCGIAFAGWGGGGFGEFGAVMGYA
ncbi:hypothetical protein VNI00_016795 [Paramarasmius palmivorus]|uniref:Uncharacterized protein n=1 Tax=Paramarasmius palmivorus TaxID=297713 RepID=A0AAW0BBH2_9AGAR